MANKLYVTATEPRSGKSAVVLNMMQVLLRHVRNVAFFRPIINPGANGRDHHIELILKHFNLDIPYEDTFACTFKEARDLINADQENVLLEKIFQQCRKLEEKYDFILCEGSDIPQNDSAFAFDLNFSIAANLDSPIALVANAYQKPSEELIASTQATLELLSDRGQEVSCVFINRATITAAEREACTTAICTKIGCDQTLVAIIDEHPVLGHPTMADVKSALNADVIFGHLHLDTVVQEFVTAAMQVDNFMDHLGEDMLIITPGDRSDIVLATLTSRMANTYPNPAGILLTGGFGLSPHIQRILDGLPGIALPILSVSTPTFDTMKAVNEITSRITPGDTRKVNIALAHFERQVNTEVLVKRLINRKSTRMTPTMFEFGLIEQAKKHLMRIVLPEGAEERILRAVEALSIREVAHIIILGNADAIGKKISSLGLTFENVEIIQPDLSPKYESYADSYFELRKHKGITKEIALERMLDPTYFGTMMVYRDDADGMVSGAINTTAHTIRPAFEFIKTKPGFSIVSSVFLMCMKDRVLAFGDCAVNPNPKAEELAEIAINSAQTAKIFGIEPRVAMLSYSTGTSGKGADVDIVLEATRIAHEKAPDLLLEGPIQYDAAIDPDVARTKLPDSDVAGKATVFIFPDLNTGNNTYKAVQRAAGVVAIGPILQGLNKPVNDLSRGCTVADIINTVTITAIQAQAEKGLI